MSSHWRLRVRTSTHEPRSFLPCSVNFRSPLASAAVTSGTSGSQVPRSQIMTVTPKRRLRLYSARAPYWLRSASARARRFMRPLYSRADTPDSGGGRSRGEPAQVRLGATALGVDHEAGRLHEPLGLAVRMTAAG